MAASELIIKTLVKRIELMCNQAGLKWAVQTEAGEVMGNIEFEVKKPRLRASPVNDWVAETNYPARLKELKPGDSMVFTIDRPDEVISPVGTTRLGSFDSSLRSAATRMYGWDNLVYAREGHRIELMRIA